MFGFIKRKILFKDTIILFLILSLISFKDFFLSCVSYLSLDFNSQIPLTWDFAALNNVFPYKEIYFPYGILFYLKDTNTFLSIIYFLLPTMLFLSIYITFKRIFRNKLVTIVSFTSFYLFVYKYTGMESFTRYGIALSFVLLLSHIFYKFPLISMKISLMLGILIGGVFSLVNDQGIYMFALFIFFLVLTPLLKKIERINYFKFLLSRVTVNVLGVLIGFLPFLIFLNSNNITYDFFLFLKYLPDFSLYAKTPFIPFSATVDNLFIFISLFIAIVTLSYKTFILKNKLSSFSILEIGLVLILILLEQKNIIRSIDKQITFIAFFLYVVMFYDLVKNKLNNFLIILFFIVISIFIILGFGLHPFINYNLTFKKELIGSFSQQNLSNFLTNKSKICLDDNLNRLIVNKDTNFEKVKKIIEKDSKGYARVFNYLSDPVFYVLFNQKPPYYFTIFEATPLYAQESNIKYIEDNKITYVIYNKDALNIQDGVPSNVRSKALYKYTLTNFRILEEIDNFTVYKKI